MADFQFRLKELKLFVQDAYIQAVEGQNYTRATFLRGKLDLLDQLIREFGGAKDG